MRTGLRNASTPTRLVSSLTCVSQGGGSAARRGAFSVTRSGRGSTADGIAGPDVADDGDGDVVAPDRALGQQDHPIGQVLGLFEALAGEENAGALVAEAAELAPEFVPREGVEAAGRLVEQEDRRPV